MIKCTNFSYPDFSLIQIAKKGGVDAGAWITEGSLYSVFTLGLEHKIFPILTRAYRFLYREEGEMQLSKTFTFTTCSTGGIGMCVYELRSVTIFSIAQKINVNVRLYMLLFSVGIYNAFDSMMRL